MAKKTINIGSSVNKGDGDPLRTAFGKINDNFDEIYGAIATDGTIFNPLSVDSHLLPDTDNTRDLGSPTNQWRHVYTAGGSIYIGDIKLSAGDGTLIVQQVTDAGLVTEAPVPGSPGTVTTDRLSNGDKEVVLGSTGLTQFPAVDDDSLFIQGPEIGSENSTIAISAKDNVLITADILGVTPKQWQFKTDGDLQLPAGGDILDSTGTSVLGGGTNSPIQPYLELTNDPFIFNPLIGESVTFTKEDYATGESATDYIDTQIAITRGENQGIYNPFLEADWDDTNNDGPSPAGTLWNKDGWGDLTNLDQRIYLSFYETFLRFGNNVLDAEAVMYHPSSGNYYKFDFTVWGNYNQGAPVTYTRTRINPGTGEPIGDPVTFEKIGYADPAVVNDPIETDLTIARGNQYSIYNIALETSYNNQGDGEDSPEGTLWNSDGWGTLRNVKQRSYVNFYDALGRIGENILNKELVMYDTINDKYWTFKFTSWTMNNNGGGFSYTRQQINTSQLFVKTDYGDEIDVFIEDDGEGGGVGITRGENQGIFNPYREEGWDDENSPAGTLWNLDGWDDFSNIETRTYMPFYAAYGNYFGGRIAGTQAVMYIPDNGKYYAIQWLSWTQNNNGGGFSYLRYELNLEQLTEGIKFTDGTILRSAEGVGRLKSQASGNRRIEEVYGHKSVSLTSRIRTEITGATYTSVNAYELRVKKGTEIDAFISPYYNTDTTATWYISFDNITFRQATVNSEGGDNWMFYYVNANQPTVQVEDAPFYIRRDVGGDPVVWWDKNDLPAGGGDFRGATIDYHAYTGESTIIGTIHIVNDSGENHISHSEVASGSSDGDNDDLWLVQNEGTISYRRIDGESKTLKIHWAAKVFYGTEYYD